MFKLLTILFSLCCCCPIAYGQLFSGTGGGIPDAGIQACFTIPVSGVGFINGAYGFAGVCINIDHPWNADLEIILKAPDGTEVPLSIQNGGFGSNYRNTCFAANATIPISAGAAPFTGTFLPDGYLGNINNGQNADGDWKLCIRDLTSDDVGVLLNWSITFSSSPAPPRPVCLVNTPAGNTCDAAPAICNLNGYCGSTKASYSADTWPELTAAFCGGAIENNSFVKFIAAGPSAAFNVWVTNSLNALGIQMMIFSGHCGVGPVATYGCSNRIFPNASGPTLVTATGLVAGNFYYIMLDGYLGDVCDYIIVAASGVSVLNVAPLAPQICPGESIAMTANGGNGNYNWSPSTGLSAVTGATVTARPDTTTTYSVTSNSFGVCPLVNSFTIKVNSQPELGNDKNISNCTGSFIDLSSQFDAVNLSAIWTNSGVPVVPPFLVKDAGTYQLVVKNLNRCSDTAFVRLTNVAKPSLGVDKLVKICPGDSVNLTSFFPLSGWLMQWTHNGDTIASPTSVKKAGSYQLIAFSGTDCSDTAYVTVQENTSPQLGNDKIVNLCPGITVDLTTLYPTTGSVSDWTLNGSTLSDQTIIFIPGHYQLVATNAAGCTDTAIATIFSVNAISLGSDKSASICPGTTFNLDTVFNTAGSNASWMIGANVVTNSASVNAPGNYQLVVSNGSACVDTAMLSLSILPKAFVGNDSILNLCVGGTYNLDLIFPLAGFTASWFLNDTLVSAPTVIDRPGLYQLIAADIAGCLDTALAEINTRPKPFIGNDVAIAVCPEIPVNLSNQVNTAGLSVVWTKNGLLVANPSAVFLPGVYRCIASGFYGCTDTAFVTISTSTKPRLGVDRSMPVCDGHPVNLSAEFFTTGYTVNWTLNGGPLAAPTPLLVTVPGAYQIVVSNNLSCSDTALINVFSSSATPLGADTVLSNCFGSVTNLNRLFDTSGLVTSWYYYGFRVTDPDSVRVGGNYQLIGSNATGCRDTAGVFLTLNPKPNLGVDKRVGVCTGTSFDLTSQYYTAGLTVNWTAGMLPIPDSTMVMAPGVFSIIAANSFGCADTSFVDLFVTNTLNLGADTTVRICTGNTVNLSGLFSLGGLSALWTQNNNPVINPGAVDSPGIYQLIASNGLGCSDTVLTKLLHQSNPSLGPDQSGLICQYNYFDATHVFPTTGLSTEWSVGGVPVIDPAHIIAPGNYILIAGDNLGCTDTAQINLVITANPFIGNDYSVAICAGNALSLTTKFNTPGLIQAWYYHGASYTLPATPVVNPLSVTAIGYYGLVATSSAGCRDTAYLRVVAYPKPALGADTSTGFCAGQTIDLTALFGANYSSYTFTEWTFNGSPVADPSTISSPGVYRFMAAYLQACYDTIFITVKRFNKPSLGNDRSINLCLGSSVGLDVQFSVAGTVTNWYFGGQSVPDPTSATMPGIYRVEAFNADGCSDTAFITIVQLPGAALGVDKKIWTCPGKPIDLTNLYNTSGVSMLYTKAGVQILNPAAVTLPGTYQLLASNTSGCSDTAFVTLTLLAKPNLGLDKADSVCPGTMINLFSLYDTTGLVVQWIFNGQPVSIPSAVGDAGTYQIIASNAVGCQDTAIYNLLVKATSTAVDSVQVCSNELPFLWNGDNYSSAGNYPKVLINAAGCDSIIMLKLVISDTSFSINRITLCNNQLPYTWNGTNYSIAGSYRSRFINAAGCDSIATLNLIISDTSIGGINAAVCRNQLPYVWNGIAVNGTGIYSALLQNVSGCDSLAILKLNVLDTSVSVTETSICSNQLPYLWNGISCNSGGNYQVLLTNMAGCDSSVNLQLTVSDTSYSKSSMTICSNRLPFIWNGNNLTASGLYNVRLQNNAGCDSVAWFNLTVTDTNFSYTNVIRCRNQLPYSWNGNDYSVSGNYFVKLQNFAGCDSIANLRLIVTDTSSSINTVEVCSNELPYLWNGNRYVFPGIYTASFVNAGGCDSVVTLHLNVQDTSVSFDTVIVCSNQLPIRWNGSTYTSAGNYLTTLRNHAGCDSIVNLLVLVNDTSFSNETVLVCSNQLPYRWNGTDLSLPGNYNRTLRNASGCDSIANLLLVIKDTTTANIYAAVCENQLPYYWNGNEYRVDGIYTFESTNISGCDSLALLHLTVKKVTTSTTRVEWCEGNLPFLWNNISCINSGTYVDTLVNSAGCDSIATLNFIVKLNSSSNTLVSVCNNQLPFQFNGNAYSHSGTYQVRLQNAAACDSIAILQLTVMDTSKTISRITVCRNRLPYRWNGSNYLNAGSYAVRLVNIAGCDSTAVLELTVSDTSTSNTDIDICSSLLPYLWNGNAYNAPGIYTVLRTNAAGCDSIATLQLRVKLSSSSVQTIRVCPAQLPYRWNAVAYTKAGSYNQTFINAIGCDSVATLVLLVKQNTVGRTSVKVCENDLPFHWNGIDYTAAGSYFQHFTNADGCDSTATLDLTISQATASQISKSVCYNDLPFRWNGNFYDSQGAFTITKTNAEGCDSIVTLKLTVNPNPPKPNLGVDTLICPGDKLLLNPGVFNSYLWQNSATTSTLEVSSANLYTVKVGNIYGCFNFARKMVQTLSNCDDIYFANAFTPNGDAINQFFGALGNLFVVKDFSLNIFNRYGKLVFSASNPYQKWNGLINGIAAPAGNYIWKANYSYRGKIGKTRNGNVVLIR